MAEILYGLYEYYIEGTRWMLPVVEAALLFLLIIQLFKRKKRIPAYLPAAAIVSALFLETAGLCFWAFGLKEKQFLWIYPVCAGFIFLCLLCAGAVYLTLWRKLRRIETLADSQNWDRNEIQAWNLLSSLHERRMTPRQKKKYDSARRYLSISMGNLSAAKDLIQPLEQSDAARYHFLMNVLCLAQSDMEAADFHARKAEELCSADTDPLLTLQIKENRAVSLIHHGCYQDADKQLKECRQLITQHRIKNRGLLETTCYNYVFNRLRIDGQNYDWQAELADLEKRLKKLSAADRLELFQIRLEILRETDAPEAQLNRLVNDTLHAAIEDPKIPTANKLILAGSTARIVRDSCLNPFACISYLWEHREELLGLPMPARYETMKQVHLMFSGLFGPPSEQAEQLKDYVFWYRKTQAVPDLKAWLDSPELPAEAIYARIDLLTELAGLMKETTENDSLEAFLSYMDNARKLCQENGLLRRELEIRLNIMDELCGEHNLDPDLRLVNPSLLREHLLWAETHLPALAKSPENASIYIRLGFYSFHLNDYERCMRYYELYWENRNRLSLKHFAPWIQRYYLILCFAARSCYFRKAVEEIQEGQEKYTLPEDACRWFEAPFSGDGLLLSMLLGRFMGAAPAVPIKTSLWLDPETLEMKKHHWLVIEPLGLEIDFSYQQFSLEENPLDCFFALNRHPMQTWKSNVLKQSAVRTGITVRDILYRNCTPKQLPEPLRGQVELIYAVISRHTDRRCPDISQLKALFSQLILPQRIPE